MEQRYKRNGNKVDIVDIIDLFKTEVLNNIFYNYSESKMTQTHSQNILFNSLDLTKLKINDDNKFINKDKMDNNIAHKELKLEIEIKIVSAHYFDTRDRFLLFDEHSAIFTI